MANKFGLEAEQALRLICSDAGPFVPVYSQTIIVIQTGRPP